MMTENNEVSIAPTRLEPRVVSKATLKTFLRHAAFAADLVEHAELIGQLGDRMDAIVHELTEPLGDVRTVVAPEAAAVNGRAAHDDAPPMLASTARGAP